VYALAALLIVRAVIHFRSFSFVLTDKSISIESGIVWQRSCTIRFDRIQDVDTIRGPLQRLLGLKSVAIWTASPDQRVGNSKRPDGLVLLDNDTADWLKDYLCDPPTTSGHAAPADSGQLALTPTTRAPRGIGLALVLGVGVLLVTALLWKRQGGSAPAAMPAPASMHHAARTSEVAVSAAAERQSAGRPFAEPMPAGGPATRTVVCSKPESGNASGLQSCDATESRRCEHESDFGSRPTPEPALLTILNRSNESVSFYWLDRSATRVPYAELKPGGHVVQQSHIGAHWMLATSDGQCIRILDATTMTVGIF
jgi:hypothetical protein